MLSFVPISKCPKTQIQPQRPLSGKALELSGDDTVVLVHIHSRFGQFRSKRRRKVSRAVVLIPKHQCVQKARVSSRMRWLVLKCLWSLSRISASICHIIEVWSFIAAIKTFQMHYIISTPAKSPDHCLKSEVSDLSDAAVDFRGCPLPHPPAPRFLFLFFHLHLTKQHNGLQVCLVLWLPLSHGDGKHSVANLKWLQAAGLEGY